MNRSICASAVLCAAIAGSASAAIITPGLYQLHNHPDGAAASPFYGLRLDGLDNPTSSSAIFSFDFDHPSSNVVMNYDGSTITITGAAYGGRDVGSGYANDSWLGVYTINFVYAQGVQGAPGDDDVWVNALNHANSGSITTPGGAVIALVDERGNFPYSFRLGDEDNDAGHRGFSGISGWGWMNHGPDPDHHVYSSDWLFTANLIPAPGAAMTLALAGVPALRRRRR